ncbi:hypothetical protein [Sorangium sp. So ce1097]|uniref:hypothetical protein n=1 Tax=Sorangium sp. So ce1097 TaxID=3133330 RepID=UPI003F606D80
MTPMITLSTDDAAKLRTLAELISWFAARFEGKELPITTPPPRSLGEFILNALTTPGTVPMLVSRMRHAGWVTTSRDPVALLRVSLNALIEEGRVVRLRRGVYGLPGEAQAVQEEQADPVEEPAPTPEITSDEELDEAISTILGDGRRRTVDRIVFEIGAAHAWATDDGRRQVSERLAARQDLFERLTPSAFHRRDDAPVFGLRSQP